MLTKKEKEKLVLIIAALRDAEWKAGRASTETNFRTIAASTKAVTRLDIKLRKLLTEIS